QDTAGGIPVRTKELSSKIQVGASVDAIGFSAILDRLPVLQDALIEPTTAGPRIAPVTLEPEFPLNESLHATLVQFEARVIGRAARTAEEILTVQFGQWITDAILERENPEDQFAGIAPGSVVRLTGVYVARLDESRRVR